MGKAKADHRDTESTENGGEGLGKALAGFLAGLTGEQRRALGKALEGNDE